MRILSISLAFLLVAAGDSAQSPSDGPVLGTSHLRAGGGVKIFNSAGAVRVVGWDRDSVLVRGHIARGERFVFNRARDTTAKGITLGIMNFSGNDSGSAPSSFVVYLPRGASASVKTAAADIDAHDVSGWFYSVTGSIRLSGSVSSAQAESINGDVDVDVTTSWVRARTGAGRLVLRGAPQDADASTITGPLDITTTTVMRGQFASVSGDIHFAGATPLGSIFEFTNHSGAVDLVMPSNTSANVQLATMTGSIENGWSRVKPAAASPHALQLTLGDGARRAQVAARTFKGTIRVRSR